ncbi:hypothetical protein DAPPUDRAFT_322677 [Daphnia pulex]|uniref:Uncharacterized protein n=1 Tax=Daphnia pulex TaxID=6669 RepID=E9GWP7_DAPPU|nr:hypothetical protein DAPPUDRAFT_322677 [Daphnia pulex]|eukprot:EFX76140.1 hypothetical protein DAPPUDRAFT_322677 [Daphnia pulex]
MRISKDVIFNEWTTATLKEDSAPANNPAADNVHDLITNRPNDVHVLMQPKPNIVTKEIIHAAPDTNNFPDPFIYPNPSEPHQHQSPILEDLNSGPATNILQVNQPDQINHNPIAPTATEDDVNLETPPTRIRHSKYPLRHREPKRQWDESLQSTVETSEPKTYMDAMIAPDCQEWKKAIQEDANIHTTLTAPFSPTNLIKKDNGEINDQIVILMSGFQQLESPKILGVPIISDPLGLVLNDSGGNIALQNLADEIIAKETKLIENDTFPRSDYRELLEITIFYLGGSVYPFRLLKAG